MDVGRHIANKTELSSGTVRFRTLPRVKVNRLPEG